MRTAWAVAPLGLVATMFSTVVPPVTGMVNEKLPSAAAVPEAAVVVKSPSVLVASTSIRLPGTLVPATVTVPLTAELSAGLVTVRLVWPWVWVM